MTSDRLLLSFNVALYCVNGVLWEWVTHQTGIAVTSLAIAIALAFWLHKTKDD